MAAFRIFYAWQSDGLAWQCKTFVREVLDDAAKQLQAGPEIHEAIRKGAAMDQDALGTAGSPTAAETIFQKINDSDAFVADLTFTGCREGKSRTPAPNPYVLPE